MVYTARELREEKEVNRTKDKNLHKNSSKKNLDRIKWWQILKYVLLHGKIKHIAAGIL